MNTILAVTKAHMVYWEKGHISCTQSYMQHKGICTVEYSCNMK